MDYLWKMPLESWTSGPSVQDKASLGPSSPWSKTPPLRRPSVPMAPRDAEDVGSGDFEDGVEHMRQTHWTSKEAWGIKRLKQEPPLVVAAPAAPAAADVTTYAATVTAMAEALPPGEERSLSLSSTSSLALVSSTRPSHTLTFTSGLTSAEPRRWCCTSRRCLQKLVGCGSGRQCQRRRCSYEHRRD